MTRPPPRSTLFPYTTLFRSLPKPDKATFAELLQMLDAIDGIERIRYTSPHPKDMREDVIRAHAERSEEHTSELESRRDLVCRLLLEKKKKKHKTTQYTTDQQ